MTDDATHQDDEGNPAPPGHREGLEYLGKIEASPSWLTMLPILLEPKVDPRASHSSHEELKRMAGLADAFRSSVKNMAGPAARLRDAVEAIDGTDDPDKTMENLIELRDAAHDVATRLGYAPELPA